MAAEPLAAQPRDQERGITIEVTARITVPREDLDEMRAYLAHQLQIIQGSWPSPSIQVLPGPAIEPSNGTPPELAARSTPPRVWIYPMSRMVVRDGRPLTLARLEFDLLLFLARHPRHVHDRRALLRAVWGHDSAVSRRTVDVHIRRLRSKLGEDIDVITTVRGVGYRFDSANQVVIETESPA